MGRTSYSGSICPRLESGKAPEGSAISVESWWGCIHLGKVSKVEKGGGKGEQSGGASSR